LFASTCVDPGECRRWYFRKLREIKKLPVGDSPFHNFKYAEFARNLETETVVA